MKNNNENINELLARFYDQAEIDGIAEDINKGDKAIASFALPKPDPAVVETVKAKVSAEASRRKSKKFTNISYKTALVAMLAVLAFGGIRTIVHQAAPYGDSELAFFWGDTASAGTVDPRLALINEQLDEIEMSLELVAAEKVVSDDDSAIDELETELLLDTKSIWRG